jgi:hypothetical protein
MGPMSANSRVSAEMHQLRRDNVLLEQRLSTVFRASVRQSGVTRSACQGHPGEVIPSQVERYSISRYRFASPEGDQAGTRFSRHMVFLPRPGRRQPTTWYALARSSGWSSAAVFSSLPRSSVRSPSP